MQSYLMRAAFGVFFSTIFLATSVAHAQEVAFLSSPLWLSVASTTEGQPVRISTVVTKQNENPVRGEVTFFAGGTKIGATDFALASSESGKVISLAWTPAAGTYAITAQITRAVGADEKLLSTAKELRALQSLKVLPDNDRDSLEDAVDPDDDNDGIPDAEEKKQGTDPKQAEPKVQPKVAGASTTATSSALTERALETASDVGTTVFETTEEMRAAADAYVQAKLKALEEKHAARAPLPESEGTTTIQFRSFKDQVSDVGSIFDTALYYVLKTAGFIAGNFYAFYLFAVVIILFIVRKIWRRYSLD